MLPIRDRHPSGRTPIVTWCLILFNIAVFLAYWPAGTDSSIQQIYAQYAFRPRLFLRWDGWFTVFTYMFIHGGWLHLGLNMLFLRIFGDNLEYELGGLRYLGFYLACGLIAALCEFVLDPLSMASIGGASGAVAGVMGGYMLMFPKARVEVALYFVFWIKLINVPAWLLLGAWLGLQLWGAFATTGEASVAFAAHIGGFLGGMYLVHRVWQSKGGRHFWKRFNGLPPHPQDSIVIPVIRRRGQRLPPAQSHGIFRR